MVNPPMNDEVNGPIKTAMVYIPIAAPRCTLSKRSERLAGTSDTGLAAKNPEKKRVIMSDWRSLVVALAMVKTLKPKMPTKSGMRRPRISDPGPQKVGPAAKPKTYRVVPNAETSWLKPNSSLAPIAVAGKTALVYAAT